MRPYNILRCDPAQLLRVTGEYDSLSLTQLRCSSAPSQCSEAGSRFILGLRNTEFGSWESLFCLLSLHCPSFFVPSLLVSFTVCSGRWQWMKFQCRQKQGQLFELSWVCNCIIVPSGRNQVVFWSLWCQYWVTPLSVKQDRDTEMGSDAVI